MTNRRFQEFTLTLSKPLREIHEPKGPPALHHYTTRSGLQGILDSRSLHASHIYFLNDHTEFRYTEELAEEVLRPRRHSADDEHARLYADILTRLPRLHAFEEVSSLYVFSMSEDPDQLSQWRAYCHPGDAYSVGFRTVELLQMVSDACHLVQCIYDEARHEHLVYTLMTDADDYFGRLLETGDQEHAIKGASTFFLLGLVSLAPVLKHPKFHEEREWRLVSEPMKLKDASYRPGRSFLVPYLPVPLESEHGLLPIENVVVGPGPHPQLDMIALSGLLHNHNAPETRVVESEIPYRSW